MSDMSEISSATKLIGWVENRTVVLESMSDGHIAILGKRKKLCYKYNHMAQWNLFNVVNSVISKFPAVLKFPANDW